MTLERHHQAEPGRYTVYLLHLSSPLAHAQHYIGITRSGRLVDRLEEHRTGQGARLIRAAMALDITVRLARQWHTNDFGLERRLKRYHAARSFCPICNIGRAAPDCQDFPALTPPPPLAVATEFPSLSKA